MVYDVRASPRAFSVPRIDSRAAAPQVIFQLTVRCLSGPELADDGDVVARLKRQYDVLAETTPSTVLLPWLPTPAMVRKLCATKVVYDTVVAALDARERGGCARDDTMQLLLDAGDDRATVIGVGCSLIMPPSSALIWFDAVHYGPLGRRRARNGHDRELAGRISQRLP